MPNIRPEELPDPDSPPPIDPSMLPDPEGTAGGESTPIKADTEPQSVTIPQPSATPVAPPDKLLQQLQTEAGIRGLRKLRPEMQETIVKHWIEAQKELHKYDPDRILSNSYEDIKGMTLGLGEGIGTVVSGLWDTYNTATDPMRPKLLQEQGEQLTRDIQGGTLDLQGLHRRLADMGMMQPVLDKEGNLDHFEKIPEKDIGDKLKSAIKTQFTPHLEAWDKFKKGDIPGGTSIMFDHYLEHPVDGLMDFSAAFGVGSVGFKGLGSFLKVAGETGSLLGTAETLTNVGEGLSKIGEVLDPLNIVKTSARPLTKAISSIPFKGTTLGHWVDLRRFVNGVFQDGMKEMSSRLMEDSEKIKDIFGDLEKGTGRDELESFSANLEGLAQPMNPSAKFKKSLEVYKQWMDLEDKYLVGRGKLTSANLRAVQFQPLMSASGMSLAELEDLVGRTGSMEGDAGETIKNIKKAMKGEEIISPEAKIAADVKRTNPEMDLVSKRVAAATQNLNLGPKDEVQEVLNDMDKEATTSAKPPTKHPDDIEDMARIARINPYAAERYGKIIEEEGMWNDYADRLQKKKPLVEKAPAARSVMVEQLRGLKEDFNKLLDQAKAETTHETSVGPTTLTLAEAGEKSGVHRTPKKSFLRRMSSYYVGDSDARSIYDMASGATRLDASSIDAAIDDIADRTAANKYGESYTQLGEAAKHEAMTSVADQIKDEIKGLRAPVERGEKFGLTAETRQQLANTIYKMHRTSYDLDRFAPPGAVDNAYDRVSEYTKKSLDEPILNPHHGEVYEYTNKKGEVKRQPRNSPIWEKGENQFKQYKRFTRRANPATIGKQERLDNLATSTARLNELRIAKKEIIDNAESVANGYRSTYNVTGVDSDADATIAHSMEEDANDGVNMHHWMIGTLDKQIATGSDYLTPWQRDNKYAAAIRQSSFLTSADRRYALRYHSDNITDLIKERTSATDPARVAEINKGIATSQKRRLQIQAGGDLNPSEVPFHSGRVDTTPPANLGEIGGLGPSERAGGAAEPVRPSTPTMKVPKMLQGVMDKEMADPRAIIGQLSSAARNDPKIMEALKKVKEYSIGRGIDVSVGEGEKFDVDRIKSMLVESKVPKDTRIKVRNILNAYNEARGAIPEGEMGIPFVAQQMLRKDAMTKEDLLRGVIKSSKEAKFTTPVYYPHQFEHNLNILDGRTPEGKQVLDNIRSNTADKGDMNGVLKRELYATGFTGYYTEDGNFVPITKGQGVRQWIGGVFKRSEVPILTKPSFLKKRTGAWGYITADPETVITRHRVQFQDYVRKSEMLDKLKGHPDVQPLNDLKNFSDLKPGNTPFSFEGVQNYYNKSIKLKSMVNKAVRDSGTFSDDAMLNAILKHIPDELSAGPMPGNVKIVQIPQGMKDGIIANLKADMPPPIVRWLIDTPTNFWKGMTLAVNPRFWLNHIVGHTLLNTLGGVTPIDYIMAKSKMFDDVYPSELRTSSFYMGETKENMVRWMSRKAFSGAYGIVGNIDNFYREAAYLHHGLKVARQEGMMRTALSSYNANEAMEALKQVSANPALKERAMQAVNEWMFDYTKLDPFERTYIRRIIPFWSFYRNISKNFYMMPLNHPLRAWTFKSLAEIGHDVTKQSFNEMGIDWEDIPKFMQGRVVVNENADNPSLVTTRTFNPYQDVLNLPGLGRGVSGDTGLPSLSPFITVPIEKISGTNLAKGKPFTDPNAHDGGYLDPKTGKLSPGGRPAPALLELIARQFPQWDLIKDISYWLRFNKIGGQYDTGNIINPKFMMDHNTGELKYPQELQLATLRALGLNIMQLDDLRKLQDQTKGAETQAYSDEYGRMLVEEPGFKDFAEKERVGIPGNWSTEDKMRMFRQQLQRMTRPKR